MDLLTEGLVSGFIRSIGFLIGITLLPKVKPLFIKAKTAFVDWIVKAVFKLKRRKKR